MSFLTAILDFFVPPKPSPDEAKWLKRIALDPKNLALITQYGEWLIQQGDDWGKLVKASVEMEGLDREDSQYKALDKIWGDVSGRLVNRKFAALRSVGLKPHIGGTFFPWLWMEHGIINKVEILKKGFLPEKAEQIFAAAPGLREISLHGIDYNFTTWQPDMQAIANLPQMEQISVLEISSATVDEDVISAIVNSRCFSNLRTLDLSNFETDIPSLKKLGQCRHLAKLEAIRFSSPHMDDEAVISIAESPYLTNLVELSIGGGNSFGSEAVKAIANSQSLKDLKILGLDQTEQMGAESLANSKTLTRLECLDLSECDLDGRSSAAILRSRIVANLKKLNFYRNECGDEGIIALSEGPCGAELTNLDFGYAKFGSAGAQTFAGANKWIKLEELSFMNCEIGDDGAAALAAADFPVLNNLNLNEGAIGPTGLKSLLAAPWIAHLENLSFKNPIGDEGAAMLCAATHLTKLGHLSLSSDHDISEEMQERMQERFGDTLSIY